MSAGNTERTSSFVLSFILLFSLVLTIVSCSQDHDVPVSVDGGIRCDSCGSECSVMCGSRNFRACCYNYIKKRSVPWVGVNPDDDTQESRSISPDLKPGSASTSTSSKSPMHVKHLSGAGSAKHLLMGYVPEITLGVDSIEEGDYIYPVTVRGLVANMIRSLNTFENKKLGRGTTF